MNESKRRMLFQSIAVSVAALTAPHVVKGDKLPIAKTVPFNHPEVKPEYDKFTKMLVALASREGFEVPERHVIYMLSPYTWRDLVRVHFKDDSIGLEKMGSFEYDPAIIEENNMTAWAERCNMIVSAMKTSRRLHPLNA